MPSGSDGHKLSPKDEWKKISKIQAKNTSLDINRRYFVISKQWYDNWKEYATNESSERPNKIDNKHLLSPETVDKNNPQLTLGLQEDIDYKIITEKEWDFLHAW